jgi:hypothetical protein
MANPWFRLYNEFAHDPKVQMLPEAMQRRLIMLFCLRCSNALVTLQEAEVAFQLRISDQEMAETKALFVAKGFIDSAWNVLNWDKRQFASDTRKARVAKHRALQKEKQAELGNGDVTLPKRIDNALDTDTDTDTEQTQIQKIVPIGTLSPAKLPTCPTQSIVDVYHEVLPTLPRVRLTTPKRTRDISAFWRFVLTTKKSDGQPRATNADEALIWVRGYFERAGLNDFLMGRGQRSAGHANWVADIDFLVCERGRRQVIERTQTEAT